MSKITGDLSPAEVLLRGNKKEAKAESKAKKQTAPKTEKKPKRDYRLNLALRTDIGEAIRAEAEKQNRSVNNLVEMILTEYLERR